MATKEECLRIMKEITNKAREEGCLLETRDDMVFTPDQLDARRQTVQGESVSKVCRVDARHGARIY
jgi:hypothetical protein